MKSVLLFLGCLFSVGAHAAVFQCPAGQIRIVGTGVFYPDWGSAGNHKYGRVIDGSLSRLVLSYNDGVAGYENYKVILTHLYGTRYKYDAREFNANRDDKCYLIQ